MMTNEDMYYELMGVISDYKFANRFDDVCYNTVKRVMKQLHENSHSEGNDDMIMSHTHDTESFDPESIYSYTYIVNFMNALEDSGEQPVFSIKGDPDFKDNTLKITDLNGNGYYVYNSSGMNATSVFLSTKYGVADGLSRMNELLASYQLERHDNIPSFYYSSTILGEVKKAMMIVTEEIPTSKVAKPNDSFLDYFPLIRMFLLQSRETNLIIAESEFGNKPRVYIVDNDDAEEYAVVEKTFTDAFSNELRETAVLACNGASTVYEALSYIETVLDTFKLQLKDGGPTWLFPYVKDDDDHSYTKPCDHVQIDWVIADEFSEQPQEKSSNVDHPDHYNSGSVECIDGIRAALTEEEFRGFCKGNALKYTWREKHKGQNEDLNKANWYLNLLQQ